MKTRTYFLISTTNSKLEGWTVFGQGSKKEMQALSLIHKKFKDLSQLNNDICAQTLDKNSRVVSKTTANRIYKLCL